MNDLVLFPGPPLCVVGNVNRDVKLRAVPGTARLFEDGETSVPPIVETLGGGGANSACAAAALGAPVRLVGKVGADALGVRLGQVLEKHGVQTYLARDPGCATGTTVVLGLSSGSRHFLSSLPNNRRLTFDDIDLGALEGCAHLLRADVWFSQAMLEGGNQLLFAAARSRGLTVSLDINFDPCWSMESGTEVSRRRALLRETLGLVDLAHGNVRELCAFTESPDLEGALHRLSGWGVKGVVVHLGEQGAGYWSGQSLVVEPCDRAQAVVNSTGTGDVLSLCMILLHQRTDLSIQEKLCRSNQVVREFMEGRRTLIPVL